MVEVFKTNIDTEKKAEFMLKKIKSIFPNYLVNFDLEDCDNILRIEVADMLIDPEPVIELFINYGFQIRVLPGE